MRPVWACRSISQKMCIRDSMEREEPEVQLQRLLTAHEQVIAGIRAAARDTEDAGDLGSTDLLSGAVLQTNELQSWFIGQHLPEASRP